MSKIYFAGKFDILPDGEKLSQRLITDFRSVLLGDSKKLTHADNNVGLFYYPIGYSGPFYCEQASNGDYTSTDCEVVVRKETEAIKNSDVFCCVFDLNFSVGSVVELIDAAYAKKRIAIFYKNESSNYTIKSEYWFAISRAMEISKANGTVFEVFDYDYDLLSVLYNWLTNFAYGRRYVSTRECNLSKFLKNCVTINEYKYAGKSVKHYQNQKLDKKFVVERYRNGLTMVKTSEPLEIKGLVDVTENPLYLDANIERVTVSNAIIEGTDGVGKTSTIVELIEQGIVCFDRSEFICQYMLFNVPMETRILAYREYLKKIVPYFVVFLTNNSREELEDRINRRTSISDFDKLAYKYNLLYRDTYMEMSKLKLENPIELVDCTGLSITEQVSQVKMCILRRRNHE